MILLLHPKFFVWLIIRLLNAVRGVENWDALLLLELNGATGDLSFEGSSQGVLTAAIFALGAFILLSACYKSFQFFKLGHRTVHIITTAFFELGSVSVGGRLGQVNIVVDLTMRFLLGSCGSRTTCNANFFIFTPLIIDFNKVCHLSLILFLLQMMIWICYCQLDGCWIVVSFLLILNILLEVKYLTVL